MKNDASVIPFIVCIYVCYRYNYRSLEYTFDLFTFK